MSERNLFNELMQGLQEISDHQQGKITPNMVECSPKIFEELATI